MKKLLKTLLLFTVTCTLINCDNDNGNAANETACNYQGFTFLDTNDNTQTLIPETDLVTDFFPNNGGPGIAAVEIYGGNPFVVFTTNAVTVGATENINLIINGNTYPVTVTCQRAGTLIGEEFRFDVTANNVEAEYCVVIDSVNP